MPRCIQSIIDVASKDISNWFFSKIILIISDFPLNFLSELCWLEYGDYFSLILIRISKS